jgi:hypothetical protein
MSDSGTNVRIIMVKNERLAKHQPFVFKSLSITLITNL